jgi:hypothetical protein
MGCRVAVRPPMPKHWQVRQAWQREHCSGFAFGLDYEFGIAFHCDCCQRVNHRAVVMLRDLDLIVFVAWELKKERPTVEVEEVAAGVVETTLGREKLSRVPPRYLAPSPGVV